jgi:hypothetical protein
LPFLTALIEDGKIDPAIALAILRLAHPAELHSCGTGRLAKVIETKQYHNARELIIELIHQFESNNPGEPMAGTRTILGEVAGSTGTIARADRATCTICVVLTSLPARAP